MKTDRSPSILFPLRRKVSLLAAALCVGLFAAPSVYAVQFYNYWFGGTGVWDTTTHNWGIDPSGSFTAPVSGSDVFYFGSDPSATAGTVTLGANFTGVDFNVSILDYTFNLAGYSLTISAFNLPGGTTTFDFGSTSSQLLVNTAGNLSETSTLTITDFVSGSSVLRFFDSGTGNSLFDAGSLSGVTFTGYSDGGAAQIDASGYVTPTGVLSGVPEPSTYAALAGLGVLGFAAYRRQQKQGA